MNARRSLPEIVIMIMPLRTLLSFAFAGLVVGVAGSVGLTRFMESLLFETEPYDPVVYLGVSLVLMAAGTAACWLPARRAARLDVASLLRAD